MVRAASATSDSDFGLVFVRVCLRPLCHLKAGHLATANEETTYPAPDLSVPGALTVYERYTGEPLATSVLSTRAWSRRGVTLQLPRQVRMGELRSATPACEASRNTAARPAAPRRRATVCGLSAERGGGNAVRAKRFGEKCRARSPGSGVCRSSASRAPCSLGSAGARWRSRELSSLAGAPVLDAWPHNRVRSRAQELGYLLGARRCHNDVSCLESRQKGG